MTQWMITVGFFLFLIVALFTACEATPPIAGANNSTGDSSGVLTSDQEQIIIPEAAEVLPSPTSDNSLPSPAATISSNAQAFNSNLPVTIQVNLTNGSDNPPQIGPVELESLNDLGTEIELNPNTDGSIQFGIYVDSNTTPGTYTFLAIQDTIELTISLDFVSAENTN